MEPSRITAEARIPADSIGPLTQPAARPVIIVVSGLPGTGKTYFSRKLADRLHYAVIESDAVRKQLFPRPSYSAIESASLFRSIHYIIKDLLKKGVSVILDATNLIERYRQIIYRIAENAGARLILVRVDAPPGLVRKRMMSRVKGRGADGHSEADWAVYQKLRATAERITRRHFTVNTSRDITPVIEKIVKEANL